MTIAFNCTTGNHKECRVGHWCECACHAPDAIEATKDRTNTEPERELAQGSTNPKDDLDEIITWPNELADEINKQFVVYGGDPSWANRVMRLTEEHQARAKARIQEYVTLARTKDLTTIREAVASGANWTAVVSYCDTELAALQRDSQPGGSDVAIDKQGVPSEPNLGKGEPSA